MLRRNGRAILGDDMGLGKTYQAIGYIEKNPSQRPVVIACPTTATFEWRDQLWEHARLRSVVIEGRTTYSLFHGRTTHPIIILSYDIMRYWWQILAQLKPAIIIFDEFHRIKTRNALRTQACRFLVKQSRCRQIIGLSGTPITNRPVEFFPILNMVAPTVFPSFWRYAMRYCNPRSAFRGMGWNFNGASNLDELRSLVKPIMLRRTKRQVMPDLPQKVRRAIPVRISNAKAYHMAMYDFLAWLAIHYGAVRVKRARRAYAMVRLMHLRRLASEGKIKAIQTWIDDWMEDNPKGKLLLYLVNRSIIDVFQQRYRDQAVVIHGGVSQADRHVFVHRFQHDPSVRLFIGSIRAAGEAITLTASSTVLFGQLGWTPAEHDQAEDRVLRIGQKATSMQAVYFVGMETVDEDNIKLLDRKRKVVSSVVDGSNHGDTRLAILHRLARRGWN